MNECHGRVSKRAKSMGGYVAERVHEARWKELVIGCMCVDGLAGGQMVRFGTTRLRMSLD